VKQSLILLAKFQQIFSEKPLTNPRTWQILIYRMGIRACLQTLFFQVRLSVKRIKTWYLTTTKDLYEQDYLAWLEETAKQLRRRQTDVLDWGTNRDIK